MSNNIKLLEDRVTRAVERLKVVSSERAQLQDELRALGEQLETLESERAATANALDTTPVVDRERVVATIREALSELRVD